MRITYVGHATVLIEIAGLRLLTDPLLRTRIGHLRRHGERPDPRLGAGLDAALISHMHADHLDRRSLDRLPAGAAIIAPRGAGALIEGWAARPVSELSPGEALELGPLGDDAKPLRVRATEADHDGRRLPLGPRAPAIGFEISAGGRRIYFAGDTGIFPEMARLAVPDGGAGDVEPAGGATGRLDLALLPVSGWGPSLGPGHMDPKAAARAVGLLKPRLAVPIHWGTLYPIGMGRWAGRQLREPPHRFAAQVAELSPGTEVRVLSPGESLDWD